MKNSFSRITWSLPLMAMQRVLFAVGLILGVHTMPASAVSLSPGDTVALAGTASAARPELAGLVLADTLRPFSIDFGGSVIVTGTVQDRVVRSDTDGTLDFYYRIFNDATSTGPIDFVVEEIFTGFSTDVDFRIDGLGSVGPDQAFRLVASGGEEVRIDFLADTIGPGEESRFFFIKTDATQYNDAGLGFIAAFLQRVEDPPPRSRPTSLLCRYPPLCGCSVLGCWG